MPELKIGDRVKVIDQDIWGEIVSMNHAYASILDDDRHEWMDSSEDDGTLEYRLSDLEAQFKCSLCEHEGHDVCWIVEPDIKCWCCVETIKQILMGDD